MRRKITVLLVSLGLVLTAGTVLAASASAGSTDYNYHGIVVKTPQVVYAYNGGKAAIHPSVTKTGAAQRNFAILDVRVYGTRNGKYLTGGHGQIALPAGRYAVRTQLIFHTAQDSRTQSVYLPYAIVTVANGGHLKVWHGTTAYTTPFYNVPNGGFFAYAFTTPGTGPCHFYLTAIYRDGRRQSLAATTAKSGQDRFVARGAVTSRFQVQGNCKWALAVNYK